MSTPQMLAIMPMLLLLTWAVATDVRCRRIPNWLTASLIMTGLTQSTLIFGALSPMQSVCGLVAGFGITFIFFALGAMGGGDVKLYAGIGAWVGPGAIMAILAVAAVVGMFIVLYQSARARRVGTLFRNSAVIVANAAIARDLSCPPEPPVEIAAHSRLPKAVPTLAAVLIVLFLMQRRVM